MKHDSSDAATDSEAAICMRNGLTPQVVEDAVVKSTRRETARRYGFAAETLTRLAKRWGIE